MIQVSLIVLNIPQYSKMDFKISLIFYLFIFFLLVLQGLDQYIMYYDHNNLLYICDQMLLKSLADFEILP